MLICRFHLLAGVLALSLASCLHAAMFDSVAGLSSSNPSGTWSYGMARARHEYTTK